MPENGLSEEVLDNTDVLIRWGHCAHDKVSDEVAIRVKNRVLDGMGLPSCIPGICRSCSSCSWAPYVTPNGVRTTKRTHLDNRAVPPDREGLPEYIELEKEETYGERFGIPKPDDLILISWFSGG